MEPQIIDYYNEMPYGVNVIEKMNEELAQLQEKFDILQKKNIELKDKLEKQNYPIVIYKDEEELNRIKMTAYDEFYFELREVNLEYGIFPHLNFAIENLLHKLLKGEERISNFPYGEAGEIGIFIDHTIKPLSNNGILSYNIIYDIIKNYIDKMFEPEECYGIVKFRCCSCNELVNYLDNGWCYGCRFSDNDSYEEDYDY